MSVIAMQERHGRMTEAEYEAERALLAPNKEAAGIRWEQQIALLFYRSGWTQEELAKKEGKTQGWIAQRIVFGRFLNFITTVINAENGLKSLSEREFRSYWEQTDKAGNERGRFQQVLKLIKDKTAAPIKDEDDDDDNDNPVKAKELVSEFADGKWHKLETMAEHLQAKPEKVAQALQPKRIVRSACKVEQKTVGTHTEYRIFKQEKMISAHELIEKLMPIVKGLEEQGRKHVAASSIVTVARLARQLRILLDEWAE